MNRPRPGDIYSSVSEVARRVRAPLFAEGSRKNSYPKIDARTGDTPMAPQWRPCCWVPP